MGVSTDRESVMRRAYAAYFRTGGPAADFPGQGSDVESINGLDYAVLRNGNGLLAVYRVEKTGTLRRLRRWPKNLEE